MARSGTIRHAVVTWIYACAKAKLDHSPGAEEAEIRRTECLRLAVLSTQSGEARHGEAWAAPTSDVLDRARAYAGFVADKPEGDR